ncbi:MAG: DUF1501 domain-containing protein [Lysobacteraceae bacterium]|nr:MAG: DUF1501 domain-containing protein [Xanthomonadaceae bacterium]
MKDIKMDRREFMKSAAAAAAVSAAGTSLFFSENAMAAANPYDTVVLVFLRGGMDGLNMVVPLSGADRTNYETYRPTLQIPATGADAALPLTLVTGAATGFGLHPSATGLRDIWDAGKLAIVHSCGMQSVVNRSHFDTQGFLDAGTPGVKTTTTGWLARAWQTQEALGATGQMPVLAATERSPRNINGSLPAIAMSTPAAMEISYGGGQWRTAAQNTIGKIWSGASALEVSGQYADAAMKLIDTQAYQATLPTGWPTTKFATQMWTIAQSIRFNLGLRFATVDLGGWDTHENQGTVGASYYSTKIKELSDVLAAFYNNLNADGVMGRVTVIVQSEFGRRVRQNTSGGTDHGYGNPLFVLGGQVQGRKFFGQWKGLASTTLAPTFGDIPVTTDYRRVLSEILMRRMANNKLGVIFPGYTYGGNMGIVAGPIMTPDYGATLSVASLASPTQPEIGQSLQPVPVERSTTARGSRRTWFERLMAALGVTS